jgi:hypothetical protein
MKVRRHDLPYAELLEADPSRVEIDTSFADRYLIRALPGANYHPDTQRWHARTSWATCITLRGLFKSDLMVGPGLIEWARQQAAVRIAPITALRGVLSAEAMYEPDIRQILAHIDMDIETQPGTRHLFTYQRADVAYLALARHGILANPPGLGKTGAAIRTAQVLQATGHDPFPLLVISRTRSSGRGRTSSRSGRQTSGCRSSTGRPGSGARPLTPRLTCS